VTVPCTAATAQHDQAIESARPAVAQSMATDDGLVMTPLLLRPIPYPLYCYQGRECDDRYDCGYNVNAGGWQGVCDDGTCMCY
jgi:hypothetical protein